MKPHSHHFVSFLILVLMFAAALEAQSSASLPPEVIAYADLVFYNGEILTADEQFTVVEAAAIRDGKFLATGSNDTILAMAGPETRRIDLDGRSAIPGLIDTHLHSAWVTRPPGAGRGQGVEINYDTLESALEGLRARVQMAQPGEVIALSGPSNDVMTQELTVALLDEIAPDNMLWIEASNDQIAANSLVLERVPANTPGIRQRRKWSDDRPAQRSRRRGSHI